MIAGLVPLTREESHVAGRWGELRDIHGFYLRNDSVGLVQVLQFRGGDSLGSREIDQAGSASRFSGSLERPQRLVHRSNVASPRAMPSRSARRLPQFSGVRFDADDFRLRPVGLLQVCRRKGRVQNPLEIGQVCSRGGDAGRCNCLVGGGGQRALEPAECRGRQRGRRPGGRNGVGRCGEG
jgi:hypothetical protein